MEELLRYFIKRTDDQFEQIHRKIDGLNAWRWKVVGISTAAGGMGSLVAMILLKLFNGG